MARSRSRRRRGYHRNANQRLYSVPAVPYSVSPIYSSRNFSSGGFSRKLFSSSWSWPIAYENVNLRSPATKSLVPKFHSNVSNSKGLAKTDPFSQPKTVCESRRERREVLFARGLTRGVKPPVFTLKSKVKC